MEFIIPLLFLQVAALWFLWAMSIAAIARQRRQIHVLDEIVYSLLVWKSKRE